MSISPLHAFRPTATALRGSATAAKPLIDAAVVSAAYWLGIMLRFEGAVPQPLLGALTRAWPIVLVARLATLHAADAYRSSWRYMGLREVARTLQALVAGTLFLLAFRIGVGHFPGLPAVLPAVLIPFGVILIELTLSALGVLATRAARRAWNDHRELRAIRSGAREMVATLLVGAGHAGGKVAREVLARPDLGVAPVGFLDDDPSKLGRVIGDLPVLGRVDDLPAVARSHGARQALITLAHASSRDIRRIVGTCEGAGLRTMVLPGLSGVVEGTVNVARIREVAITDLLRREAVHLDLEVIARDLAGSAVLVTGAGGSIGSELCRQILPFRPSALVMVDRAENGLFNVHGELAERAQPGVRLVPCVADVCDAARMRALLARHRPAVLLHAAAHKHVPMMEDNPGEAVKVNVLGTRVVADAANDEHVGKFVLISTDKAVNPTSIMGVTKRAAELYVQSLAVHSATRFMIVRFGNVLGSAGSVVPTFRRQIACGGPVTVTDPGMHRFFMTIPEAGQLVLQAAAMGGGADVFVLDMGPPVRIVDLARDMIRMSGLEPGDDIEIAITGMRPGEKLFEELHYDDERAEPTGHPKVWRTPCRALPLHLVCRHLAALRPLADEGDPQRIRARLKLLVTEYEPWPQTEDRSGASGMTVAEALG